MKIEQVQAEIAQKVIAALLKADGRNPDWDSDILSGQAAIRAAVEEAVKAVWEREFTAAVDEYIGRFL